MPPNDGPSDDVPLPPYVTREDVQFAVRAVVVHAREAGRDGPVWCDSRTTGGRCVLPAGHLGPCGLTSSGNDPEARTSAGNDGQRP
ncbi:hypothetical protein GA0074692_6362 [Micromonospora pallida]|uniref:Uncharacterized protein n=1 Tax=Micromonospora pallida TaxID=145854 RepID=A0A1C6TIF4_9ACTN|nr:hypothetical protein GA0074692_6362 [Micromonospora pallida]